MLYRLHELAYRTQYAELKERAASAGALLPGTPGTLYERAGTGRAYVYRVYYSAPGRQVEDLVAPAHDEAAIARAAQHIEFARWTAEQVATLRKLGFQVADKAVARVLVELHNAGAFDAGLAMVGSLAFMAWLNELGARAVAARTQDLDLARRQRLRLAAPLPFLATVQATRLPFVPVPALPSSAPSTSVKLPGADGLRIDLLAPSTVLGRAVRAPELEWHAQGVPHYDWLLEVPASVAALAGGHCVPVRVPAVERLVWHKLYSSAARHADAAKADKDLLQAVTLAAIEVEQHDLDLRASWRASPGPVRAAAQRRLPAIRRRLTGQHPQALDAFERALR
ncbi:MAG TPA: GSU2403 family nucleotidyltransferase fold protein [Caldimonas sp.]|nr:GSU2403 family nucleotidyltransferase fold protein [Caldimonas sp.]